MPGAGAAWSQSERRFPAPAAAGRGGYRGVGALARLVAHVRTAAGRDRGRHHAGGPRGGHQRLRRRPLRRRDRQGSDPDRVFRSAADGTLSRMATDSGPGGPAEATTALAERLFRDMVGALELYTVYLGERLGLYRALDSGGPATSSELAERTGTAERYIREWLEHHAASGLLEVDDPS